MCIIRKFFQFKLHKRPLCYPHLFVFFQVAESRECSIAELAGVRSGGVVAVGVAADVGVHLGFWGKTCRRRRRAWGRRLATATRVGSTVFAVPRWTSGSQGLCNSRKREGECFNHTADIVHRFLSKILPIRAAPLIFRGCFANVASGTSSRRDLTWTCSIRITTYA